MVTTSIDVFTAFSIGTVSLVFLLANVANLIFDSMFINGGVSGFEMDSSGLLLMIFDLIVVCLIIIADIILVGAIILFMCDGQLLKTKKIISKWKAIIYVTIGFWVLVFLTGIAKIFVFAFLIDPSIKLGKLGLTLSIVTTVVGVLKFIIGYPIVLIISIARGYKSKKKYILQKDVEDI